MLAQLNNRVFSARLIGRVAKGENAQLFTFQVESPFTFLPGQYVWLVLPELVTFDEKGARRALSIVNRPNANNQIEVLLRAGESGFKQTLFQLPPETKVQIVGPFGSSFCLPTNPETDTVLLAGGVGIAPFASLAREYSSNPRKGSLMIICSDENRGRMPLLEELEQLVASTPGLKVLFTDRKIENDSFENIDLLKNAEVYISGSQGFVDHCNDICVKAEVSRIQMHFENFYPTLPSTIALRKQFLLDKKQIAGFFQSAVECSTEHIIITDVQGVVVFANKAAEKITGYRFSEMLGQTPRLWGGMMPDLFYRKLWQSKRDGIAVDKEIINRRKNGSLYEVMAHIAPIRDQFEQIIGYIGTEEDISAVRKAEREAQQSEKRFLDLATAISEVYWIVELQPSARIGYVSPAFEQIWGTDLADLHQNPESFLEAIQVEDQKVARKSYTELCEKQIGYDIEYRVVRPDGSVAWVNDKREAVMDEDGKPVRLVGVVRDITQRKSIDRAKSEFVSLASHQLKTPIGSLNWDAESLLNEDHGALTPKQREVIAEMYKTNQRMKVLVNSLLNISRLDLGTLAVKLETSDPVALCEGIIKDLRGLASERDIEIVTSFDPKIPVMSLDTGLMNIIIQNIVSNAVKYSPQAQKVMVEMCALDDCLQFEVKNQGDPIANDEKEKIFTKLYRGSNAITTDSDGNGLGLYMVKSIIDLTGGRIYFTSSPEEGTIFTVRYPLGGMVVKDPNLTAISI